MDKDLEKAIEYYYDLSKGIYSNPFSDGAWKDSKIQIAKWLEELRERRKDIVVFQYDMELGLDAAEMMYKQLQKNMPEVKIIAIPNTCSISKMSEGELKNIWNRAGDTLGIWKEIV